MLKLFLTYSGEHDTLPISEITAILDVESCRYSRMEVLDQVVRLEGDLDCSEALQRRAAFTRSICLELFTCEAGIDRIAEAARAVDFGEVLQGSEGFEVRVKHVKEYSKDIDGMLLEKKLGALLLRAVPEAKVELRSPDRRFLGILTEGMFVFGLRMGEIAAKPFVERRPRGKPFFHPSALQAKLARCMVNLAKPKTGELVLDPFCGTGTTLIEAGLIGCRALGVDVQRRMATGTLKNLGFYRLQSEGVLVADVKNLPIMKVDCVATDPPYGISSTTLKRDTRQIVTDLLKSARDVLEDGRCICLAAPKSLGLGKMGDKLGYRHLESHYVYVHRSLTREIAVFEKVS